MLYREIIAVCSQSHTKHINTLCGQNVQLLNVKPAVHILTTGLLRVRNERDMHITQSLLTSLNASNSDAPSVHYRLNTR